MAQVRPELPGPDAIAHGQSPGHVQFVIRGLVQNIWAGHAEGAVWAVGGEYPWPSAAQTLEAVSSSSADTAAGTGARSILIQGLDASWNQQQQVVALSGATPAAIPGTWLRVNNLIVFGAGSGGRNAGTINVRIAGAGTTLRVIPLFHDRGTGISLDGIYTVPTGHLLYLNDAILDVHNILGSVNYNVEVRDNRLPTPSWLSGAVLSANEGGTTTLTFSFKSPLVFTEKMDIQVVTTHTNSPVFHAFSFVAPSVLVSPGYFTP